MRFRDLDQHMVGRLWDRWKYIVRDILDEFNEDVYHGTGIVHENSYGERIYLSLETKTECFYVFPIAGNVLILRLYRGRIEKEHLSLKSTNKLDHEKLIGQIVLKSGIVEERYARVEDRMWCLQKAVRLLYLKYSLDSLF
jgi:hypothetical protein